MARKRKKNPGKTLLTIGVLVVGGVVVYKVLKKKEEPKKKKGKVLVYSPTEVNGLQIDLKLGDTLEVKSPKGERWQLASDAMYVEEATTDVAGQEQEQTWRIFAKKAPKLLSMELPYVWTATLQQVQPDSGVVSDFTVKIRA